MYVNEAAHLLKKGEVVAFPTETVYGLGADAWNSSAIKKVFEIKGRPSDNPLIVHIHSKKDIQSFAMDIPDYAALLMDVFWPGPLTLVLKKRPEVLDSVTAGLGTVALRIPNHPIALQLLKLTGALVAPSANRSGKPSSTKAQHVIEDFGSSFPVIDGMATEIGLESTVIDVSSQIPVILRPGAISKKQLEEVLGIRIVESFSQTSATPKSPGQKYSHYKPNAAVSWLPTDVPPTKENALYLLQNPAIEISNQICYHGDLNAMARELYDRFRQVDLDGFEEIIIELLPTSHSLYTALTNRISKAIDT